MERRKKRVSIQNTEEIEERLRAAKGDTDAPMRKRERLQLMAKLFQGKNKPFFKNKAGLRRKKHFGLWKYFISGRANDAGERRKFYISMDCRKLTGQQAKEQKFLDFKLCLMPWDRSNVFEKVRSDINIGYKLGGKQLEDWGLPIGIVESFLIHAPGIRELFDWQAECLSVDAEVLLGRRNLVYFAPTSGGKSMVAEILLLRSVLGLRRRALYVLPFVSIVTEKEIWLTKLLENVNVRLQAFHS